MLFKIGACCAFSVFALWIFMMTFYLYGVGSVTFFFSLLGLQILLAIIFFVLYFIDTKD